MQILLFRHGIAEEEGPDGSDFSRRLSEEGVVRTGQAAAGLARIIDPPQVILTSPRVRARQTADLLAEHLTSPVEELKPLADHEPLRILQALRKRKFRHVMMVGHEPTFSEIVEMLCAPDYARGFVKLKKAGCACVEADLRHGLVGGAELIWLATPKMLRAMS